MGNSTQNGFTLARQNFGLITLGALVYLLLLFLTLSGYQIHLLLFLGFAVTVGLAFRFPMTTVVALLITGVLPTVFQLTPIFDENYGAVGGGLNAVDIVLVGMASASALQVWRSRKQYQGLKVLYRYVVLFGLWLLFEIVRNVSVYGISAPGEFRFRYLMLVLPLYVGVFFRTTRERKKLYKLLVFSAVTLALISIPFVGTLKGWRLVPFGTNETRLLPSHITLGLVYGLLMLFLARRYNYITLKSSALWIIAIPVLFMVLIDSHRSVWLVSFVILLSLLWLKEIRVTRIWRWGIPVLLIVGIVWYAATRVGLNVLDYIETRGIAFVNPEEDESSAWRLEQWEIQISKFYNSPITGEGFGPHFGLSGFKGDIGISPHSVYVQSLVKLGLVGVLLYLLIVFKVFSVFRRWIQSQRVNANPETALVLTALVCLVGGHVYFVVYPFDYYSLLFVGLGVAVVRNTRCAKG